MAASISIVGQTATLTNGDLTVEITNAELEWPTPPELRFLRTSTGQELLAEQREHFWWPGARVYYGNRAASGEIHQQFRAYPGERLYGMGQRTHGRLDHKGLALDLVQRNGEVSIPFVLSSRGYGLLWNNPAVGRVEFADNVTRWTAAQARGDRLLDHRRRLRRRSCRRYADATGHAPRLPAWASGFWQSKLRYRTPGRAAGGRARAPASRPAAVGHRDRLLPLDRDGRLPVRPRRMARSRKPWSRNSTRWACD